MKTNIIQEYVGYSNDAVCLASLHKSVKNIFKLTDDVLKIENNILIFLGKSGAFGAPTDNYLLLIPKLQLYCKGFVDGYRR